MAEAVAGWLVCPIIKIVVEKAASDRIKWMGDGVPKACERLRSTLVHLQTVASAVQLRGSSDRCRNLRAWLQQLMDAVYEAQDVLDDFDDSDPHPESSVVRFGKRILGADERVNRLKDVVDKLEAIEAGYRTMLSATETIASASVSREPSGNHTGPMRPDEGCATATGGACSRVVWPVGEGRGVEARRKAIGRRREKPVRWSLATLGWSRVQESSAQDVFEPN